MQVAQRWGGVDAEVVGEPGAGALVVVEGVGGAPASVEREHQLPRQALVERVFPRRVVEGGEELGVLAEPQRDVVAVQLRGEPLPLDGVAQRVEPRGVHGREGLPSPQGQRPVAQVQRDGVVLRGAGPRDEIAEEVQVDGGGVDGQPVAAGLLVDTGGRRGGVRAAEDRTEPGQIAVESAPETRRWLLAPHPLAETVHRDDAVGVDQQRGEDAALPGMAEIGPLLAHPHLDVAQHREPRHLRHLRPLLRPPRTPECSPVAIGSRGDPRHEAEKRYRCDRRHAPARDRPIQGPLKVPAKSAAHAGSSRGKRGNQLVSGGPTPAGHRPGGREHGTM